MIIDDDAPETQPTAAAQSAAAPVSRVDSLVGRVSDAKDRAYARPKAEDFIDDADAAETLAAALLNRWRSMAVDYVGEPEAIVRRLIGTFRGHVDRLAMESQESLFGVMTKARDNLNRQVSRAEEAIDATIARAVQTPDELTWVIAQQPVKALEGMVSLKMAESSPSSAELTADVPEAIQPPPPPPPPPPMDMGKVRDAAKREVQRIMAGLVLPTAGPPVGGGGIASCGAWPAWTDFIGVEPAAAPSNAVIYPGTFKDSLQGRQVGNVIIVPDTRSLNSYIVWYGWEDGTIRNLSYVEMKDYGHVISDEDIGVLRPPHLRGIPNTFGWAAGGMKHLGYYNDPADHCDIMLDPSAPPPPSDEPPPPPPPPEEPPPTPPAGICCDAPEPVTNNGKARRPTPLGPSNPADRSPWCDMIRSYADSFAGSGGINPKPPDDGSEYGDDAEFDPWWATAIKEGGRSFATDIQSIFGFSKETVKGSPAEALTFAQVQNQELMKRFAITFKTDLPELEGKSASLLASYSLISWAEKFTGAPLMYLGKWTEYAVKYMYPRELPSPGDCDQLYLAGRATDDEWECMVRSHGLIPSLARRVRDTKETKLNIAENVDLYVREMIEFPELQRRLKFLGVHDDGEIQYWINLRNQIPQMPDLLRFMVRDVENEEVVREGGFDSGFSDNWKGKLAAWGRQQGVPDEVALYNWRAHWELPSPTMSFEMLARLRPGRVPADLEVTDESIRRLLNSADYAPGWQKRMMAISYLTPTRTDIKSGYFLDAFDRKELIELLKDTKLDDKGAESVAKVYDAEKSIRKRTLAEKGTLWTVKSALREYAGGFINEKETRFILETLNVQPKQIESGLRSADLRAEVTTRHECTKAAWRRYQVGELNGNQVQELLVDGGIDIGQAEEMVKQWSCKRAQGQQEVPARKNLEWAVIGVITLPELERRLTNLRFKPQDVERYLAEAIQRISDAQAKLAEKRARDALAAIRRSVAEAKKRWEELKKLIKEEEKRLKELQGGGKK